MCVVVTSVPIPFTVHGIGKKMQNNLNDALERKERQ